MVARYTAAGRPSGFTSRPACTTMLDAIGASASQDALVANLSGDCSPPIRPRAEVLVHPFCHEAGSARRKRRKSTLWRAAVRCRA